MIDEKDIETLTERLVRRIEEANIYFLKQIGNNIKQFKGLSSSDAHKLSQILKYNGNYNEIINKISKLTNINIKEIDEIFSEFAKTDQRFFKEFYEYRNIKFIPYNENKALINQVKALATITKQEMYNFSRTQALGYSIRDLYGNVKFTGLKETYNKVLDEAVLNVSRGVDTFDNAMSRIMKDIGESGLKTLDFESGRSIRLDSMVRQHLQNSLRNLHNEMQKEFGKEFSSDGIEVSHHLNPAPDHEFIDGQQFSNEEFDKINSELKRPVGELNCNHYIFPIILGVSKPEYTKEQLEEDKQKNKEGFEIDGKHYTLYEGTQLMRKMETTVRKTKDTQIIAKASGNKELVADSQRKITQLTQKYKELSKISGLPTKMERMRVSGYKRVNVNKM
jgi:hypothetical protein